MLEGCEAGRSLHDTGKTDPQSPERLTAGWVTVGVDGDERTGPDVDFTGWGGRDVQR